MNKNYREWGNTGSSTVFQNKLDRLRDLHDLEVLASRFGRTSVIAPSEPKLVEQELKKVVPITPAVAPEKVGGAGESKEQTTLPIDKESLLYNRLHFDQTLEYETNRALRYHRHLSVCLVRIGNPDNMLASLHSQEYSRLIFSLGRVLKDSLRGVDIPARYDENSFAILLPETDAEGVALVAERIHGVFKTTLSASSEFTAHKFEVSISLGCACFPSHAKTAIGLIDSAQRSLETAASRGGNMVCML